MREITIPHSNEKIPILGMGTYGIFPGQSKQTHEQWKEVLRTGIELGITHIDTAELYGDGHSEKIVGDVIKEYPREDLFITTKMLPSRTSESQMKKAINNSLNRLGVKYVDLYLIHWLESHSSIPTIMAFFEHLIDSEKTRYIGVSNFSVSEVKEAQASLKKYNLLTNQVKINIRTQQELKEKDFYDTEKILLTAYTPLAKANLSGLPRKLKTKIEQLAKKYNCTSLQIALAWVINQENVIAIPRTSSPKHLQENATTAQIVLTEQEIESLNT
ncbi:MAG: hypothetical protein BAJALOKI1v1_270010 [Promethearchaeota archaeon]|nr:MAG: hypothetical protein BAJALOKI1v1_270010 [Candidatus Lokiarchaeota archaeon]